MGPNSVKVIDMKTITLPRKFVEDIKSLSSMQVDLLREFFLSPEPKSVFELAKVLDASDFLIKETVVRLPFWLVLDGDKVKLATAIAAAIVSEGDVLGGRGVCKEGYKEGGVGETIQGNHPRGEEGALDAERVGFIATWNTAYKEKFGHVYKMKRPEDPPAIARLLKAGLNRENLAKILKDAWDTLDGYLLRRSMTIVGFDAAYNEIMGTIGKERPTEKQWGWDDPKKVEAYLQEVRKDY